MSKLREFCADCPKGKTNCSYAEVRQERCKCISYTVGKSAIGPFDSCWWIVYCNHPNKKGDKKVGVVMPYGGKCYVPVDCPELKKSKENSILRVLKSLVFHIRGR